MTFTKPMCRTIASHSDTRHFSRSCLYWHSPSSKVSSMSTNQQPVVCWLWALSSWSLSFTWIYTLSSLLNQIILQTSLIYLSCDITVTARQIFLCGTDLRGLLIRTCAVVPSEPKQCCFWTRLCGPVTCIICWFPSTVSQVQSAVFRVISCQLFQYLLCQSISDVMRSNNWSIIRSW